MTKQEYRASIFGVPPHRLQHNIKGVPPRRLPTHSTKNTMQMTKQECRASILYKAARWNTHTAGAVFLFSHWHGILVQCVGTVFLFSGLARYSCLVTAFMLEGGAVERPECWRGVLVQSLARYSCLVCWHGLLD